MAIRLNMFPEDCVSTILSLTSAANACRFMLASSSLRSAAKSDLVWGKFLPSELSCILSRTHSQLNFSSKKELYFKLCDSILLDGGIRVIELKTTLSIEIEGKINTKDLSPNTTYGAYLIIQVSDRAFGLDSIASEISVSKEECSVSNTAYLCPLDERKQQLESLLFMNRRRMMEKLVVEGEGRRPSKREDGWMEIELGEFFVGQKNKEVQMKLMEVKGHQLKGGLIIEGIEIRPKC
ncbi:hypothetical protein L1887_24375 [Cichorium endivia]|nr:hypothetical protein L1887_24375 [Cichorium endivia]